ncbi:Rho guanine nucleotide exchange factor [Marasmius tenuissimus]|nr:Rho guanine nucleotide exchange factor [Marasmius tenuissimus]
MAKANRKSKKQPTGATNSAQRIVPGAGHSPAFSLGNSSRSTPNLNPSPNPRSFSFPLGPASGNRPERGVDRVIQAISGLTGAMITLSTKTGQRYEGIIMSTRNQGDTTGVTLKDVKELTNPAGPLKLQHFIASTNIDTWQSGPADAVLTDGDSFRTDTDISCKLGETERELEADGRKTVGTGDLTASAKPVDVPKAQAAYGLDGAAVISRAPGSAAASVSTSPALVSKPLNVSVPAFHDWLIKEKVRLTQKRLALAPDQSDLDRRKEDLVKFSQSFKFNKPIPELDLVRILAKDEDRRQQIRDKSVKDANSSPARLLVSASATHADLPSTSSRLAITPLKTETSKPYKPAMFIQAIPPFKGVSKAQQPAAPGIASSSTSIQTLASASVPPKAWEVNPATPNSFFSSRSVEENPPVNVLKDDFNPFGTSSFADPPSVSGLWPYTGELYMQMFSTPGPAQEHSPHMAPPMALSPVPSPPYEEDLAAQDAVRMLTPTSADAFKQREATQGKDFVPAEVAGPAGKQTDEELERIQAFFEDAEKCRKIIDAEGDEAQRWLDFLQTLTDYPGIPRQSRSTIFKIMLRLSKKSGMFPRCLKINNVEKLGLYPVAGGGFGDVWKGKIAAEIVCLKVVKVYLASDVQQLLNEFMQEAIVWQQLKHPNILPFVGMYYFGEGQGQLCLVSPWMEQGNLVAFLKNAPPEMIDRMLLVSDIASGLAHLHGMKIVHGDMKGVNVLITPELRACIGDFGLSHVADSHALRISTSFASRAKGTTRWLAPELLDPQLSNISTDQSDMYAYGCVCYEIFAGHPPFHGLTDGAVVVAVLVRQQYPSRPGVLDNDVIWELMTSCWSSDPSLRPTAADILERIRGLSSIQGGIPVAPDWKAFAIDAIRSNVEYPPLDFGMLTQL